MKIVECLTNSGSGGGQQLVFQLCGALQTFVPGVELSVALPAGGVYVERFETLGVRVHQVGLNTISFSSTRELTRILNETQPDVVHSHGKGAGFHARRSKGPGKRIHSFHGFHPPEGSVRRKLYFHLERSLAKKTEQFVFVSESEKEEVVKELFVPDEKCSVISNIVDVEYVRHRAEAEPDRSFMKFLDENKNRFVVAMTGRTDPLKNYPLALHSVEILLEAGEPFAFVFIGLTPDFPLFVNIQKKYPSVLYASAFVENVTAMIARVQAIMLTSKKEGSPLAISEGQALGKPAVGTNVAGIRDAISHNENGLLCEETPGSIAAALRKLQSDQTLYRKLSEGAGRRADTMNMKDWVLKYFDVYRRPVQHE